MENAFGKIVAILILVTMLFIIPIRYGIEKSEALEEMYVSTKTVELVDSVRNTGFITRNMYEQYLQSIGRMNRTYEINMEHIMYEEPPDGWISEVDDGEKVFLKTYVGDAEMENKIYSVDAYTFKIEDYFKIQVYDKNGGRMVSYYGGYIKNEAY